MTVSPNDFRQALIFAQAQHAHPTQSWEGMCQSFVRKSYGLPGLFGTAYAQWLGVDDEDKHIGGNPDDAPIGSALCFKGSNPDGHIDLAARPFHDHDGGAWSNDLVTYGHIDKVLRSAPETHWGQKYLGYLTAVNGYDLQLKVDKPAVPKHDKRYKAIEAAIESMEHALARAQKEHDTAETSMFEKEISDLKALYSKARHA